MEKGKFDTINATSLATIKGGKSKKSGLYHMGDAISSFLYGLIKG